MPSPPPCLFPTSIPSCSSLPTYTSLPTSARCFPQFSLRISFLPLCLIPSRSFRSGKSRTSTSLFSFLPASSRRSVSPIVSLSLVASFLAPTTLASSPFPVDDDIPSTTFLTIHDIHCAIYTIFIGFDYLFCRILSRIYTYVYFFSFPIFFSHLSLTLLPLSRLYFFSFLVALHYVTYYIRAPSKAYTFDRPKPLCHSHLCATHTPLVTHLQTFTSHISPTTSPCREIFLLFPFHFLSCPLLGFVNIFLSQRFYSHSLFFIYISRLIFLPHEYTFYLCNFSTFFF